MNTNTSSLISLPYPPIAPLTDGKAYLVIGPDGPDRPYYQGYDRDVARLVRNSLSTDLVTFSNFD